MLLSFSSFQVWSRVESLIETTKLLPACHCRHFSGLARSIHKPIMIRHGVKWRRRSQEFFLFFVGGGRGCQSKMKGHLGSWHHKGCASALWIRVGIQTLWLAVGVALVPIGALVTLTVNNTERQMKKIITISSLRYITRCRVSKLLTETLFIYVLKTYWKVNTTHDSTIGKRRPQYVVIFLFLSCVINLSCQGIVHFPSVKPTRVVSWLYNLTTTRRILFTMTLVIAASCNYLQWIGCIYFTGTSQTLSDKIWIYCIKTGLTHRTQVRFTC